MDPTCQIRLPPRVRDALCSTALLPRGDAHRGGGHSRDRLPGQLGIALERPLLGRHARGPPEVRGERRPHACAGPRTGGGRGTPPARMCARRRRLGGRNEDDNDALQQLRWEIGPCGLVLDTGAATLERGGHHINNYSGRGAGIEGIDEVWIHNSQ